MAARTEPSLLDRLRAHATELAEAFRRADRFAKLRLGIVGSWAVLSLATLWGACVGGGPRNALGADVQVNGDSIMGVQVLVRNESQDIWKDVVLTLDDRWMWAQPTMRPQDLVVVSVTSFRHGEDAPPKDFRPHTLVIACRQGKSRVELR
jgi:hypothetical protein